MKKKVFAVISAIILLCFFASCKKNTNSPTDTAGTSDTTNTADTVSVADTTRSTDTEEQTDDTSSKSETDANKIHPQDDGDGWISGWY